MPNQKLVRMPLEASSVTGIVMPGIPGLDWQYQLMIFSGLSVVSIALFRRYQRRNRELTDQPTLKRRGEQSIGRTFTLDQPIVNRDGSLPVDDSTWRIAGNDLPAGTRVTVTGVNGVVPEAARATD